MKIQHAGCRIAFTVAVGLFLALPAAAAPVTFNFNTITLAGSHGNGLGATADSTAIGANMGSALGTPVTVTGALATKTYNGEGHVNGPTLGTSDNNIAHGAGVGNDTFIINDNFGIYGGAASSFSMTFGGGFYLTSVAFDWEIFPDARCPASTHVGDCGGSDHSLTNSNWPDIELMVNGVATPIWSALATIPGTSPKDPQAIGTLGAALDLTGYGHSITSLTFVDWPAEIGIDNLTITGACLPGAAANDCLLHQNVPEPGSMLLLGIALAALAIARRRINRTMHTA